MLASYVTLSSVFTTAVPDYRCRIPACDAPGDNASYGDAFERGFDAFTIPYRRREDGEAVPEGCLMFPFVEGKDHDGEKCTPEHFSEY